MSGSDEAGPGNPKKVYSVIARALVEHGTEVIFGMLGDANMMIADDLARVHGVRYVSTSREDGAVLMADGYARVSGRLGVATVTQGPGLTNTVTALVEAARARTPVVVVCGDTPPDVDEHLQDIEQREIVLGSGAGFVQVRSARTAAGDVAVAVRRAWEERRPIVLNAPTHVQLADAEAEYVPVAAEQPGRQAIVPDPEALDRAVGLVASARRPVILAGRGAVQSGARDTLLRLASILGAPVATTLGAKDYFADSPFNLGLFGTLSTSVATTEILKADCVVAFGASLNRFTAADGSFLKDRRVVQVDTDPTAIARWRSVDVGIFADATATAAAMCEYLQEMDAQPSSFCSPALAEALAGFQAEREFRDRSTETTVDLRTALIRLDKLLPADRGVASDAGMFCTAVWRYLHVPEPAAFVWANNFGSVGLCLAEAVGAAVAAPGRPSVAVMGDGGFMMGGILEFNTAVRHGLDLIVIVVNDGAYGAEYYNLTELGMDPALAWMSWPDFAAVADALGGRGMTVHSLADLELVSEAVAKRDRPLLIDLRVDVEVSASVRRQG
ncbi:conserved hypothetical protein [Frankia canadensis]|uniref:Acetolactate synthase n=1 Tax=Frankia canadensis TaxID=1836972 RepID=A0A2I2KI05_9ACTN|nr:thiamine pyrophosphate-binding protein [Frankia canadensis]SNQ45296.1 conserved hypothetical protein [Frankia canadensis]SOU52586.1 conserved hypothetical protein [Frankia canadensis]